MFKSCQISSGINAYCISRYTWIRRPLGAAVASASRYPDMSTLKTRRRQPQTHLLLHQCITLGLHFFLRCTHGCTTGTEGDFRLGNKTSGASEGAESGFLEVFHAGAWGTLCDGVPGFVMVRARTSAVEHHWDFVKHLNLCTSYEILKQAAVYRCMLLEST